MTLYFRYIAVFYLFVVTDPQGYIYIYQSIIGKCWYKPTQKVFWKARNWYGWLFHVAAGCGAAAGHQEVSSIPGGLSLLLPGSWHWELQASPGSIASWLIKAWLETPNFRLFLKGKIMVKHRMFLWVSEFTTKPVDPVDVIFLNLVVTYRRDRMG